MALGRRIRHFFRGEDIEGGAPESVRVKQARGLRETAGPTTLTMGAVADGEFLKRDGTGLVGASPGGGGLGDVVGPASAVDERIAVFDSTTGKLIKDGGSTIADIAGAALTTEQVQDIVGAEIVAGTGISVNYDDGAATVTVTSTVSGGEDDRLMRVSQILVRARDSNINFPGLAATPGVSGTQSQNNGSTGAFHKRTTAATTGQTAGWTQNSNDTLHREFSTDIVYKIRTDSDLTNIRLWVAITSATISGSSTGLGHLAAFRYATDVDGTAFWRCVTRDNSTDNTTTTSLAIAANTTYLLRIVESASDVKFYYHDGSDWQLLATHSANLPSTTEDRWFHVILTTLENVAKAISLGYIHIRHK